MSLPFSDGPLPCPRVRVALVHDWMVRPGGAERVLLALHNAFPDAPIYTSVYRRSALPEFADCDVRTSFLQRWPLSKIGHQFFPSLRSAVFESLDLSAFDVVISHGTAEAKGVITSPDTLHVSLIHTPTRYYWSEYQRYRTEPGFGRLNPLIRAVLPFAASRRRTWDFAAAQRPDRIIANSANVARRVKKYYRRDVDAVIYPPIDLDMFPIATEPPRGFVTVSRLIPYKRVDLAVEACRRLGRQLTVVGDGSELRRLRAIAGPETSFVGTVDDRTLVHHVRAAEALLFPGEEDFGMVPLEAAAAGRPCIAYGRGGALETVLDGRTGVLFDQQTAESLMEAIARFDTLRFDPAVLRAHSEQFSAARFVTAVQEFVEEQYRLFSKARESGAVIEPAPSQHHGPVAQ
jgi:glycosyltransferase involved in cell wall biosynthesis